MKKAKGFAGALVLTQAGAVLLFLSWLLPPTAALWQSIDEATFRVLNGSLRPGSLASHAWAWLNIRASDLIPAILIYVLAVTAAGRMQYQPRMQFIYRGLALAMVMLAVITVENLIEFSVFSYHRASPTLVMDNVVRLSEIVPFAKDFSPKSFPGDHGYVLICFSVFFARAAAPRYAIAAVGIAIFFSLPRLIGGAHWLTDIVVGSGAKALLTTGWLVATPLWDRLAAWLERRLEQLPINPVAWACRFWWGEPEPNTAPAAMHSEARQSGQAA
jgi:Kdo2-lipid A phosphotransferase